jgi:hypothetical protein
MLSVFLKFGMGVKGVTELLMISELLTRIIGVAGAPYLDSDYIDSYKTRPGFYD